MTGEQRIDQIADKLRREEEVSPETVRGLLSWFGARRRGVIITERIQKALQKANLVTEPNFEEAYIDGEIIFCLPASNRTLSTHTSPPTQQLESRVTDENEPGYKISRLKSANTGVVSISPDDSISKAATLMMQYDYSQLPVIVREREVLGLVSWKSLGKKAVLGIPCTSVRECMEEAKIVDLQTSIFHAVSLIIENDAVLVRNREKKISGIVTAADISEQFKYLAEPFLLIGEIENQIRRLLGQHFSPDELSQCKDERDTNRVIEDASDLTFGEYVRVFQNPKHWDRLGLKIDRVIFSSELDQIRTIRNDVMHFDPDGIPQEDLAMLRRFVRFLQDLHGLGAI